MLISQKVSFFPLLLHLSSEINGRTRRYLMVVKDVECGEEYGSGNVERGAMREKATERVVDSGSKLNGGRI